MKKSKKLIRFLLFFCFSFVLIGYIPRSVSLPITGFSLSTFLENQSPPAVSSGIFVLTNFRNGKPLVGYTMAVTENRTGTFVTAAKSDKSGLLKVEGLIPGQEYQLKLLLDNATSEAPVNNEAKQYVHEPSNSPFPITVTIERKEKYFQVATVLQNPELPNGCEITALTAILNYFEIDESKKNMAKEYLPKEPFKFEEGLKIGPDPNTAYAGDPREQNGGWYVFAPPIVEAAEKVINDHQKSLRAENISGSNPEEILTYMDQNIPVMVWVTKDLSAPVKRGGWYIDETNEFHASFTNLHTVVLHGWKDGEVYVMDPLKGTVSYPEAKFFESYLALGSQAIIIK